MGDKPQVARENRLRLYRQWLHVHAFNCLRPDMSLSLTLCTILEADVELKLNEVYASIRLDAGGVVAAAGSDDGLRHSQRPSESD